MTQTEFDEKVKTAIHVRSGEFNIQPGMCEDFWIYYIELHELEHRFRNGAQRFQRPLSCIDTDGQTVKVLFRTDMSVGQFIRLLLRFLEEGGASLDQMGFSGIESEDPKPNDND